MGKDDGIESLRRRLSAAKEGDEGYADGYGVPANAYAGLGGQGQGRGRTLAAALPTSAPAGGRSGAFVHVAVGPGASSTRSAVSQVCTTCNPCSTADWCTWTKIPALATVLCPCFPLCLTSKPLRAEELTITGGLP